jgi:hypothetical protein
MSNLMFSPSQLGALKKVTEKQKAQAKADTISMIIEVVGGVATGFSPVVGVVRMKQKESRAATSLPWKVR